MMPFSRGKKKVFVLLNTNDLLDGWFRLWNTQRAEGGVLAVWWW